MTPPAGDANDVTLQMRLRTKPRSILRLSRKVLIAIAAVSCMGLAAALTLAMTPMTRKPRNEVRTDDHAQPVSSSPEALSGLPKDYGDVPRLGPPLPGDLGRPLLASAAQSSSASLSGVSTPDVSMSGATMSGVPEALPGSYSRTPNPTGMDGKKAALGAQIFFAGTQTPQEAPSSPAMASHSSLPSVDWTAFPKVQAQIAASPEPARSPNDMQAFLEANSVEPEVSSNRLRVPASPYLLQTGSVISAALVTGLNSDIPGQVIAQVTEDVFDSLKGQYLLIPRGSRLIGAYDNRIAFGQSRLLLVWTRLILPNGQSLLLDRLTAADEQGFAGLKDRTDYHWAAILNAGAISTLLSVGAQSGDADSDRALIKAIRSGASDSFSHIGDQIVSRQLTVQPTLTARAGLTVRVILSRDLVLTPYGD